MDSYQQTFDAYDKMAQQYQDKFMDMDIYNATYDAFCALFPQKSPAVLEIACGPGNITRYLLQQRPDFRIHAIDMAPNMLALAQANNPAASFELMDCRNISKLTMGFDGVIAGFCVPYISATDCQQLVADCNTLLPEGGVVYLSAIEGNYEDAELQTSSDGRYSTFVYYYSAAFFEELFREHGFTMKHIIRVPYPKGDKTDTHLVVIGQKN